MQDTESLGLVGLVHWDDPEGWYGEGSGRGVQDWEHVYTCGGFMLIYALRALGFASLTLCPAGRANGPHLSSGGGLYLSRKTGHRTPA